MQYFNSLSGRRSIYISAVRSVFQGERRLPSFPSFPFFPFSSFARPQAHVLSYLTRHCRYERNRLEDQASTEYTSFVSYPTNFYSSRFTVECDVSAVVLKNCRDDLISRSVYYPSLVHLFSVVNCLVISTRGTSASPSLSLDAVIEAGDGASTVLATNVRARSCEGAKRRAI